jgi:alkylated DNA repair dioxygenase AlkB
MELFKQEPDAFINLLPSDGIVNYYGIILKQPDYYFTRLMQTIQWENDKAVIFGKTIITKRKVAWYGDKDFSYTYSKTTKKALPWTTELLALKAQVEQRSGEAFNSCLLNLYHNGTEGMTWHSDAERDLKRNGAIASLSLGAERKFSFKHKNSHATVSLMLEHGSLLLMRGTTQTYWLHRLPPAKMVISPRINLTFRTIDSV